MKKSCVLLMLLCLCSYHSSAMVIRQDVPDSAYLDAAKEIDFVCQITLIDQAQRIVKGTGILIAPDAVLTAAHVVESLGQFGVVRLNQPSGAQDIVRRIAKVVIHPDYMKNAPSEDQSADLAVVFLSKPVRHIIAAKLSQSPLNHREKCLFCTGYGVRGDDSMGIDTAELKRIRKETNLLNKKIHHYLKAGMICSAEKRSQFLSFVLKKISKHYQKRLVHIPIAHIVLLKHLKSYYFSMKVFLHDEKKERYKVPRHAPSLYGVPVEGDSGSPLMNECKEVVGVLNHAIKCGSHMLICWLDLRPYANWIDEVCFYH